ncbi:hypothetical protein [Actinomadura oligospora]|uniref:hypothetical protein n=1 Tax=Actinomadura oligospora TaxID=111804 RepID=UPI00047CDCD6|nr:hypothetical protein [Actinomadura oligospora]
MFATSDQADWRPLLTSAADCFAEALSRGPLPARLVETVLDEGNIEFLRHLVANKDVFGDDLELQARVTATGHPTIAAAIVFSRTRYHTGGWWPLRGCRDVLATARPHADWTNRGGAVWMLEVDRSGSRRALVVCPLGRAARSTLIDISSDLTRAEQLRGLLTVHDHDGGLGQLAHFNQDRFRPEVAEVLRTVLAAGDVGALREAVAVAEGTEGLIEELYGEGARNGTPEFALDMLGLRVRVDWEALRRAHAGRPFGDHALEAFATRPDCPAELRPSAPPAPVPVPLAQDEDGPDLAVFVAKHLGDDVEAWRAVRARLSRFRGDLADLLTEVGEAAPSKGRAKATGWPGGGDLPAWDGAVSVSGARAKFLALLDAASVETQLKLLRHLDDRTVADLFGQGAWQDAWLEFAMNAKQKRYRLALAQRPSLAPEAIEVLMSRNDPALNARLFLRTGATGPQRERLLSGRLSKDLVERLMERDGGFRARDAVSCSNVRLQRHILALVRVRGIVPQQRLMLNLWERGGPDAVRDLLENEPEARKFSRKVIRPEVRRFARLLVAEPDAGAALERMRATVTAGETAQAQAAVLRERGTHPSASEVFREAHLWRWDELIDEHRREPLGTIVLLGLAELPECPRELRDEAERQQWRWFKETNDVIVGETPEEILRDNTAGPWLHRAVSEGAVTWEQAAALAHPAEQALAAMTGPDALAALTPLVREHLDPSRDSWVLALRMLPSFTGSVSELLHTAALATATSH